MEHKYVSVYALNKYIKAKMNQDVNLQKIYIKGEISNYRPHPSGHLYFTLKDEQARVSAIMFQSAAKKLNFSIENGMQVFICGSVSVYEATGQYQLYVQTMEQDGIGQLYLKFDQLKKKLEKEGLFDDSHKKRIPTIPKTIAVLSAKQGAALQDILRTIHSRFPLVRVIVFPIPVQGFNAYLKIIEVLKYVDQKGFDTIIIARGGGSIEDLWNFNEEALARCIFSCQTPIISGVGHETDFTICDFVSDLRAATPTAAAMKATPDQNEMRQHLYDCRRQLIQMMNHLLKDASGQLSRLKNSYYLNNPEMYYSQEVLRLTHLQDRLQHQFDIFDINIHQELIQYQNDLKRKIDFRLQRENALLQKKLAQLDALSPLKVMQRGYTLIKEDDHVIKSVHDLHQNDDITIQFYDGVCQAKIK